MLLAGAVGFGILAAVLATFYLKSKEAAIRAGLEGPAETFVPVVVAKEDLPKGIRISGGYFAVREAPAEFVHPNAVHPQDFESVQGRFLVEPMAKGKPLLSNFLNETFPVDFSDTVREGRRAMTVTVDEINSIAGLIRPGNFVDIYVNIATQAIGFQDVSLTGGAAALPAGGIGASEAFQQAAARAVGLGQAASDVIVPVLQSVRVLATADATWEENLDELMRPQRTEGRRFTNITVDVSPTEAALLATAADKGDLLALLRNRKDKSYADFTGVTPFDLFAHATEMQQEASIRAAAAAAGATVDENGDWVMPDGTVIEKDDIVVSPNGTVMTKGGKLLAGNGIRMNENGQYVDENGKVIDQKDIVFNADGTVTTKQALLEKSGYRKNAAGQFVDAHGNVIDPEDVIVGADGKVTTKGDLLAAAGYSVNEDGDYVDRNGNVIPKDDVVVLANGTVMTKDGQVLAGPTVTRTKDGFLVDENGRVMTADGQVLQGVTVNASGEVVTADGTVLTDPNLAVAADGTVRDSSGNEVAGVTVGAAPTTPVRTTKDGFLVAADGTVMTADGRVLEGARLNERGEVVTADGQVLRDPDLRTGADGVVRDSSGNVVAGVKIGAQRVAPGAAETASAFDRIAEEFLGRRAGTIDLIIGGQGKDGVAPIGELPVLE
jgi:pilus assembly protein CpaB